MKRALVPMVALAAASTGALLLSADIKSGLQVGCSTEAFIVKDITGPAAGQSLCYR